jgi:hypothetical protein
MSEANLEWKEAVILKDNSSLVLGDEWFMIGKYSGRLKESLKMMWECCGLRRDFFLSFFYSFLNDYIPIKLHTHVTTQPLYTAIYGYKLSNMTTEHENMKSYHKASVWVCLWVCHATSLDHHSTSS